MEFVDLKSQYRALRDPINDRIQRVLDHGQFIMGPEVRELEERLSAYVGARHCVTVASGTEALLIALMALGLRPGDEVITTPFSFIATAEVIVLLGAKPVFVDIDPLTCNINAAGIESKITARTRAIMPVSLYGQVADMDEINVIAARHRLPVIEDAAQSFGASYRGAKSCHLSEIACTSFFPSKPLGCYGDGGALFTDDDTIAQSSREIRVHGQSKRYVHTRVGLGGRMDTLQCAIVLAKLERFEWEMQSRLEVAARYDALFAGLPAGARRIEVKPGNISAYAQYTLAVPSRDHIQQELKDAGIPTAVHYPVPMHRQPAYSHLCCPECCPVSETLASQVISLPMHPDLDAPTQELIARAVITALSHAG